MKLGYKFWGVRGSLPTAPMKENLSNRVQGVVDYVLNNLNLSRDALIDELRNGDTLIPFGANTACVEVLNPKAPENEVTILDCGSGLKWLGDDIIKNRPEVRRINFFISHTHWDHISGFPFFTPAYIPHYEIHIYSPVEGIEQRMILQQNHNNFPIQMDLMASKIIFHQLDVSEKVEINGSTVTMKLNDHPGKAYSFKVDNGDNSAAYMTDAEVNIDNIDIFESYYASFLQDVDILVFDAQYDYLHSYSELSDKAGWGHSSSIIGVDICNKFKIKRLLLFHYDPSDTDVEIQRHFEQSVFYKKSSQYDFPREIHNTAEGKEFYCE